MLYCTPLGGVCQRNSKKSFSLRENSVHFLQLWTYSIRSVFERRVVQMQPIEINVDLDDLIFSENDGLPSDR